MTRRQRQGVALLALLLAALALLPGRFLLDATLIDSWAIRAKTRALTAVELFLPDQADSVNRYWRPLFHLLHHATDALAGGSDVGLRLLALGSQLLAALGLASFARALRLPRSAGLLGALLFVVAPPNVTTAAWPVAASWPMGVGLTLLAAADFVRFARAGGGTVAARGLALALLALGSSQAAWHLVLFLPLLVALPPTGAAAGSRRRRPLLLLVPIGALSAAHLLWLEPAAGDFAATSLGAQLGKVAQSLPRFLESGLGGDPLTGSRPVAWLALGLAALGAFHDRRRAFVAIHAVAAAAPFVLLGHTDRYALLAHAVGALAFAACAPVGVAVVARALARSRARLSRRRVAATRALVVGALLVALLLQVGPRLRALAAAAEESRLVAAGARAAAPALRESPPWRLVNAPPYFDWAELALRDPLPRGALVAARQEAALCTRDGYFALQPLEQGPLAAFVPFEWDGERLVERSREAPMGGRRWLPPLFLAGGIEIVAPEGSGPLAELERERRLVARTRELADPLDRVLLERMPPGLALPLPRGTLDWTLEEIPAERDGRVVRRLFSEQLAATAEVERPALLVVAVTWLAPADPLRWIVGTSRRWCELFEATIDGAPAAIEPAFAHLAAIVVPAGRHSIVFRSRRL